MARKELSLKGAGNDAVDYREFITALMAGTIQATALHETTRVSGEVRKLTKLEYDEPAAKGDLARDDSAKQT
jgi:hypothetical protein